MRNEIARLEKQLDELASLNKSSRGYLSEEAEREHYRLMERWWRGEDLSEEDPKAVADLDEYGPIAVAVTDEHFDVNGTADEYAETYLSPRAAQARRRRMEGRQT